MNQLKVLLECPLFVNPILIRIKDYFKALSQTNSIFNFLFFIMSSNRKGLMLMVLALAIVNI
jgi:hypothetical protein